MMEFVWKAMVGRLCPSWHHNRSNDDMEGVRHPTDVLQSKEEGNGCDECQSNSRDDKWTIDDDEGCRHDTDEDTNCRDQKWQDAKTLKRVSRMYLMAYTTPEDDGQDFTIGTSDVLMGRGKETPRGVCDEEDDRSSHPSLRGEVQLIQREDICQRSRFSSYRGRARGSGHDGGKFDSGHDGGKFDSGHDGGKFDSGHDGGKFDSGHDGGKFDSGHDDEFDSGHDDEFDSGHDDEFDSGHDDEFDSGHDDEFDSGHHDEFDSGHNDEFDSGHDGKFDSVLSKETANLDVSCSEVSVAARLLNMARTWDFYCALLYKSTYRDHKIGGASYATIEWTLAAVYSVLKRAQLAHQSMTPMTALAALYLTDQWADARTTMVRDVRRYFLFYPSVPNLKRRVHALTLEQIRLLKRCDWRLWIRPGDLDSCLSEMRHAHGFLEVCEHTEKEARKIRMVEADNDVDFRTKYPGFLAKEMGTSADASSSGRHEDCDTPTKRQRLDSVSFE